MGNTSSSRVAASTQPGQVDEKAQVQDQLQQLDASLSRLQVAVPLSSSGQLTLDQVASWEDAAAGDSKTQLARTILSHADVRSALMSRAAKIADQHVFNHVVDFKTGPVTDQKSSGRCWLFATTNVLRYNIMKKFKLKDFQLSQVSGFSPVVTFSADGSTVLSILLG
jgi:bleomycin hydrolase